MKKRAIGVFRKARPEKRDRRIVAVGDEWSELFPLVAVPAEQIPPQDAVGAQNPRVLRGFVGKTFEQCRARRAEGPNVHLVNGRPIPSLERTRAGRAGDM